jgi:hypothetical protein
MSTSRTTGFLAGAAGARSRCCGKWREQEPIQRPSPARVAADPRAAARRSAVGRRRDRRAPQAALGRNPRPASRSAAIRCDPLGSGATRAGVVLSTAPRRFGTSRRGYRLLGGKAAASLLDGGAVASLRVRGQAPGLGIRTLAPQGVGARADQPEVRSLKPRGVVPDFRIAVLTPQPGRGGARRARPSGRGTRRASGG